MNYHKPFLLTRITDVHHGVGRLKCIDSLDTQYKTSQKKISNL